MYIVANVGGFHRAVRGRQLHIPLHVIDLDRTGRSLRIHRSAHICEYSAIPKLPWS